MQLLLTQQGKPIGPIIQNYSSVEFHQEKNNVFYVQSGLSPFNQCHWMAIWSFVFKLKIWRRIKMSSRVKLIFKYRHIRSPVRNELRINVLRQSNQSACPNVF